MAVAEEGTIEFDARLRERPKECPVCQRVNYALRQVADWKPESKGPTPSQAYAAMFLNGYVQGLIDKGQHNEFVATFCWEHRQMFDRLVVPVLRAAAVPPRAARG